MIALHFLRQWLFTPLPASGVLRQRLLQSDHVWSSSLAWSQISLSLIRPESGNDAQVERNAREKNQADESLRFFCPAQD